MAPRRKVKSEAAAAPGPKAPPQQQTAPWIAGMKQHFVQTGHYRPEDLTRLLGDPRDSVQGSSRNLQICANPSLK
jgi:hypothetical protein